MSKICVNDLKSWDRDASETQISELNKELTGNFVPDSYETLVSVPKFRILQITFFRMSGFDQMFETHDICFPTKSKLTNFSLNVISVWVSILFSSHFHKFYKATCRWLRWSNKQFRLQLLTLCLGWYVTKFVSHPLKPWKRSPLILL